MASYLVQRLAGTIPVLLLISLLVFLLIHAAPGDPTLMLLGEETNTAEVAKAKAQWGLDRPLYIQYLKFVASTLTGEFGKSFKYAEPVSTVIKARLPATIELAIFSIIIAVVLAIPLGVWAGSKPNSWLDNVGTTFGLFGISMPSFWLGIMLILLARGRSEHPPHRRPQHLRNRRTGNHRFLLTRQPIPEELEGGMGRT